MPINFGALAGVRAKMLSGQHAGEAERDAAARQQSQDLFSQYAKNRQFGQEDAQLAQQADLAKATREMTQGNFDASLAAQNQRATDANQTRQDAITQRGEAAAAADSTRRWQTGENAKNRAAALVAQRGATAAKPLKLAPQKIVEGVKNNERVLSDLDALESALAGHEKSVGVHLKIPGAQTLAQYTDPEGDNVRQLVSSIGGKQFTTAGGKTLTVNEILIHGPGIMRASDTPDKIRANLKLVREHLLREQQGARSYYNSKNGVADIPDGYAPTADPLDDFLVRVRTPKKP